MSFQFEAAGNQAREVGEYFVAMAAGNPHVPSDGRIQVAARALLDSVPNLPPGHTVLMQAQGHNNADGTGWIRLELSVAPPHPQGIQP